MRGVTPERVSKGGVSDAESKKGVTPGHRVIVRGVTLFVSKNRVTPSDWVSARGVMFRLVGHRGHGPLQGTGGLSKIT